MSHKKLALVTLMGVANLYAAEEAPKKIVLSSAKLEALKERRRKSHEVHNNPQVAQAAVQRTRRASQVMTAVMVRRLSNPEFQESSGGLQVRGTALTRTVQGTGGSDATGAIE